MFGKLIDPGGQNSHLHFRRTGVLFMDPAFLDDLLFLFSIQHAFILAQTRKNCKFSLIFGLLSGRQAGFPNIVRHAKMSEWMKRKNKRMK
jgi:hypothetical protein